MSLDEAQSSSVPKIPTTTMVPNIIDINMTNGPNMIYPINALIMPSSITFGQLVLLCPCAPHVEHRLDNYYTMYV